jgi:nicotinate-nucleotide adenylyltransferase
LAPLRENFFTQRRKERKENPDNPMSPAGKQRIGVFGGTFDPVHLGHLIMAEQCREQAKLDQVWFVPAARPPHKLDRSLTPFAQRAEMLSLALAGTPAFRVDDLEKDRPGPSYTADTLEELHRRNPAADFALLLGSDCLPDLAHWKEPSRIVERAELLVFPRPAWPLLTIEQVRQALHLDAESPLRMQAVNVPLIHIASRDLRQRVAENRSIRFFVPRAVECYIQEKKLYR